MAFNELHFGVLKYLGHSACIMMQVANVINMIQLNEAA